MGTFSGMCGGKKDPCQDGGRLLPPLWVPHCRRDPPPPQLLPLLHRERAVLWSTPCHVGPNPSGSGRGFWPWIPGVKHPSGASAPSAASL